MRLKSAALLALGLWFVSLSLSNSAISQTSLAPPLSLAAPSSVSVEDAAPAATGEAPPPPARRSKPSAAARDKPPAAALPPSPQPAADYDGFSVGTVDEDAPVETAKPVKPRATQKPRPKQAVDGVDAGAGASATGQPIDQIEDEKLRRKLMICQGCKG